MITINNHEIKNSKAVHNNLIQKIWNHTSPSRIVFWLLTQACVFLAGWETYNLPYPPQLLDQVQTLRYITTHYLSPSETKENLTLSVQKVQLLTFFFFLLMLEEY